MTTVKTEADLLLSLAERCEKATGPDRELDAAIHGALGGEQRRRALQTLGPFGYFYTTSLDAAMKLVPEGAGTDAAGERFRLESWTTNGVHASHIRATAWVAGAKRVYAATPALALCAASLRAKARGDAPSSKGLAE